MRCPDSSSEALSIHREGRRETRKKKKNKTKKTRNKKKKKEKKNLAKIPNSNQTKQKAVGRGG